MRDLLFISFVLLLILTACKKEEPISENQKEIAKAAAHDYLEADKAFNSIFKTMDKEAKQQGDLNGYTGQSNEVEIREGCPDVSLTTNGQQIFPALMVLDYGSDCNIDDDIPAAGKISIEFTGLLLKAGTSISMNFENFEYNHYKVGGTYLVTNDGKDANGQLTYTATLTKGILTDPDGKNIQHNFTRVRKWIEGQDTNFFTHGIQGIQDDVWAISVTSNGVNKEGITYQISTQEPLRAELSCQWPVSGKLELYLVEPGIKSSIDFGDGTCDNKALLTTGGFTTEIEL